MTIMADQTAPAVRRRRIITAGRIGRPTRCTLTIPLAVLREYDYTDQAAAHADGVCARLYAIGRRMANDACGICGYWRCRCKGGAR